VTIARLCRIQAKPLLNALESAVTGACPACGRSWQRHLAQGPKEHRVFICNCSVFCKKSQAVADCCLPGCGQRLR